MEPSPRDHPASRSPTSQKFALLTSHGLPWTPSQRSLSGHTRSPSAPASPIMLPGGTLRAAYGTPETPSHSTVFRSFRLNSLPSIGSSPTNARYSTLFSPQSPVTSQALSVSPASPTRWKSLSHPCYETVTYPRVPTLQSRPSPQTPQQSHSSSLAITRCVTESPSLREGISAHPAPVAAPVILPAPDEPPPATLQDSQRPFASRQTHCTCGLPKDVNVPPTTTQPVAAASTQTCTSTNSSRSPQLANCFGGLRSAGDATGNTSDTKDATTGTAGSEIQGSLEPFQAWKLDFR